MADDYTQSLITPIIDSAEQDRTPVKTHTLIIGNGPSGLSASAFLSGWRPFYHRSQPHPSSFIHRHLIDHHQTSLLDQDLSWWDEKEGTGGVSVLYDRLTRPDTDIGHEHPSSLRWEHHPELTVPHILLGEGPAGGAWAHFSPNVYTVSLSSWLALPGLTIDEWEEQGNNVKKGLETGHQDKRLPCSLVQEYYANYPVNVGIDEHAITGITVTGVDALPETDEDGTDEGSYKWCPEMVYSLPELDKLINSSPGDKLEKKDGAEDKDGGKGAVVVVGSGLSAADTVVYLLLHSIPVHHVFRSTSKNTRSTILGRLSRSTYPEYHTVARLMLGKVKDDLYHLHAASEITSVDPDNHLVHLSSPTNGNHSIKFKYLVFNGGNEWDAESILSPELAASLLGTAGDVGEPTLDSHQKTASVLPNTNQSVNHPSAYFLGPLIGHRFVRYLVGGAMGTCQNIISNFQHTASS